MRRILVGLLAANALFLTGCDFDLSGIEPARFKEDFHSTHDLKQGGRLELETFNGSIEIKGWDKDSVEIFGTKYANSQELLAAIKIDVASTPESIRIRSVRPPERWANMGVKYVISVPRKTILDRVISSNGSVRIENLEGNVRLKTSNGSIRAFQVKGDLDATTSNGNVEVKEFTGGATVRTSNGGINADGVRGFFEATTSNGSVDAHIIEASGRPIKADSSNGRISLTVDSLKDSDIRASTTNSSITVRLPGTANARLKARTSNSSVSSDFDLTERSSTKTSLEGKLGSGGPMIDISTSNGSIRLSRM